MNCGTEQLDGKHFPIKCIVQFSMVVCSDLKPFFNLNCIETEGQGIFLPPALLSCCTTTLLSLSTDYMCIV